MVGVVEVFESVRRGAIDSTTRQTISPNIFSERCFLPLLAMGVHKVGRPAARNFPLMLANPLPLMWEREPKTSVLKTPLPDHRERVRVRLRGAFLCNGNLKKIVTCH
jgi:hypothetical protein